jgi:hypothetical protein
MLPQRRRADLNELESRAMVMAIGKDVGCEQSAMGATVQNSLRASCGYSRQRSLLRSTRLIAIGLMTLALAACGGGDGDIPTTTGSGAGTPAGDAGDSSPNTGSGSTGEASVLDCLRENFPCSFDEVALPIIERSLALSDEVAKKLRDGVDIQQVAAFLSSQSDMADVTVDGPVLGFRLTGGRPMIVDVTGEQEILARPRAANAAGSAQGPGASMPPQNASQKQKTVRSAASAKITGDNKAQRHALVLSPFRYEENFGDAGELMADALDGVRGYKGNVTYLATTNELDPQVTVDVLTQLEKYDVIHMDTHGGTLCKKKDAALDPAKDKQKCEDGITDFLVQRFHGTAQDLQSIKHPGVIHYTGRLHQSIAITADFFRHYYPQGLSDKLFVLGSCNTFRTDMANAIAGNSGVYVSWDGYTEYSLVKNTGLTLLDSLGLGLTMGEAFARMPTFSPENPEAQGSTLQRTQRKAGGDLRIRDLITVRDNLTGEVVTDASGIEVMEKPEDGENDNLDLELIIDGITPEQLEKFHVNLVVDNQVIGQLNIKEDGVPLEDFSYRVTGPVALPFDVAEGQALNLDFWIALPDTGEDHFIASPKVNERDEPKVGKEWVLSSVSTESHHDSSTTITASVEFELDSDDDPTNRSHYFYVKSGKVRVQRDYEDATNCRFHIDQTIDLQPGASNNYLVFDVGNQPMTVEGFGRAPNTYIEVTGSCGAKATVNIGGVYFMNEETAVTGDSAQGMYNDGTASPTIIEWTLDRTL